ncbi:histidinol-phosphate transaminase [Neobacillus sp. PS3-34]|uniref:histidinol-phosphate transaminase n=1 Tax=Neobacillus sp. PS3-34 TaxID=3070678 RepID=UPI0027DF0766|nr:histidinol-phosphate transaminase [Neobacillus sp. PS3-34]WML47699.1 histidinol-phosphate transaminase [Neobacillus sp. PS3-34]
MRWKKQLLELSPYLPGKSIEEVKKQYGLEKITKLASNENPFGCSDKVLESLKKYQPKTELYPDGYATNLRETLAEALQVDINQLLFGNGSDEIIQIISRALLHSDSNTVMATPTFPQYRHNAILEGAEVREVPLKNGDHDLDGMLAAVDEKTNVIWLCSPNNPTGTYISEEKMASFLSKVPQDILVVIDEAYYEYAVAEDYHDSINLLKEFKNLIVLRTFSKIYGLASMRVGYGIADRDIIRALEPAREPFNTNSFAQLAAKTSIEDTEFVEVCKLKNREGLEQFYQFCGENALEYFPSQGNFILINFNRDGDEVFQYLLSRGFIVRSGKALGFPSCVRITVGSKEQNEGLIELLKEFLAEEL